MARIVVIDDDTAVRQMLRFVLVHAGHEVLEAHDGRQGVQLLVEHMPVDLLITDIVMSGQEGMETIVEVRKGYPALKILAISGGGQSSAVNYLKMARLLGANDTLSKPFEGEDLLGKVRDLIAGKPTGQASPA